MLLLSVKTGSEYQTDIITREIPGQRKYEYYHKDYFVDFDTVGRLGYLCLYLMMIFLAADAVTMYILLIKSSAVSTYIFSGVTTFI